jgi:hypothetical protein
LERWRNGGLQHIKESFTCETLEEKAKQNGKQDSLQFARNARQVKTSGANWGQTRQNACRSTNSGATKDSKTCGCRRSSGRTENVLGEKMVQGTAFRDEILMSQCVFAQDGAPLAKKDELMGVGYWTAYGSSPLESGSLEVARPISWRRFSQSF